MSPAPAAETDTPTGTTPPTPGPGDPIVVPGGAGPGGGPPGVIRRRLAPYDARIEPYSWFATGLVTFIAGIIRLIDLDRPGGKIFDEVYYATDAHYLFRYGFEWDEKNNTAGYVVHPPLGKWMIGIGEQIFGYPSEFGWRVSAAAVGTLSVLMLVRVARRMFGSTVLGCAAGLLMAFDGMHFVLSRTALLDIFLMFFILAAFGALVLDRDATRRRWLARLEAAGGGWARRVPWWRLAAAVLFGGALAVKWSALWFLPVFALLALFWAAGARRSAGVTRPWRATLRYDTGWLVAGGVLILIVYLSSWSGWLFTDGGYFRHWLADSGRPEHPVTGALANLWHYHQAAYEFHSTLTSKHPYQSWPWQWLLLGRPVAFHWSNNGPCGSASCASEVLLLGTPVLWWSFLPALAGLAWLGVSRRDWRAAAIGLCVAAGLLPWFWFALDSRTMFYFYALPAEPFLVLAVVYVFGAIMNPVPTWDATTTEVPRAPATVDRRLVGALLLGGYVLLVAACFAYFYPVYTGQTIPYGDWSARMWLGGRWI